MKQGRKIMANFMWDYEKCITWESSWRIKYFVKYFTYWTNYMFYILDKLIIWEIFAGEQNLQSESPIYRTIICCM